MHRIFRPVRFLRQRQRRRGLTTPAVAVALLVIMMGLALIVDRIWLETAQLELWTAAESAALAAAGELASDRLLQPNTAIDLRMNNARQIGGWIAEQNYVCGSPVTLNVQSEGDIRFGHLVEETQGTHFKESSDNPTTVVVTALRTRANNNPVALFVTGATGLPFGDVATRAEATIENSIVGLRPFEGSPIPALPIAIWKNDPTGRRSDTWDNLIESMRGADEYSYDEETHAITAVADGLPEIRLHSLRIGGDTTAANVQLLDVGTALNDRELMRQFETGISVDDLKSFDGEMWLGQGEELDLTSSPEMRETELAGFQQLIGERRICFLYSTATPQRQSPIATTTCTAIVAVRVMVVTSNSDGSCDVTVQPSVMTSRTALLASEVEEASWPTPLNSNGNNVPSTRPNRYLYKMRLTN